LEGQVVKVTELNPQLGMEIRKLLGTVEGRFTLPVGCELFAMLNPAGQVLGAACVAGFDECCLLLFIAVRPDERGRGTGSMVVNHVLTDYAGKCERMYLFTEAVGFFERFGFTRMDRDRLPDEIYRCAEEGGILTQEAVAMSIDLPKSWARK
jgi:N-acetylglutamate synthase-like GNAT family acetyltransferase